MPLNLNQCDISCTECIKQYKKKFNLKQGEKFNIKCNGIPKKEVIDSALAQLSDKDKLVAKQMLDPVTWAANILDWHCLDPDGSIWKRKNPEEYYSWVEQNPNTSIEGHSRYHRPYQAIMLRCQAKRKVFRVGRQAGKCLPSGTLIQMADGTQKPIEAIQDGDIVASINENYEAVTNPAYRACNGYKYVAQLELMDGRSVQATLNHPFLTRSKTKREITGAHQTIFHDEWKPLEAITTDDYIAVPRKLICQPTLEDDICTLEERPFIASLLGLLIGDGDIKSSNLCFSNTNPDILNEITQVFKIEKRIPDWLMKWPNDDIRAFLRSYFGCDGWVCIDENNSIQIGCSTVSEELAQQILALLARFEVYADIQEKVVKLNGKKFYSKQLTVNRKSSITNFYKKIGILGKDKAIENAYLALTKKDTSYKTEVYEKNDVVFIKVKSVTYLGKKMTWDLTVPESHNFIANNIVTHNTESIIISMAYHLFTKPGVPKDDGFEIILITPYQSQIELIFTRLEQLIRSSPQTRNSIARSVKGPNYQIKLHNHSVIKGFTAGTRSGGNAEAVRGQHGNMLVFDEADYLSRSDMDAALSIITNYPNASMWVSSTPTGRREKFYEICHDHQFKEFHFTSQINPLWSNELNNFYQSQLTETGYQHEILANFGEQEEGVFQNCYVQAAKCAYQYGDLPYYRSWTYTMGVDWNDTKNGTTIAVLGLDPVENKFYLVDKHIVSKDGWTQLSACLKIRDCNRLWKPISIYVDAGYGSTQHEILRKYGFDAIGDPTRGARHPDALLRYVKKYDFGSNIEVRDLWTKEKVKKNAKPFLVEAAMRRFESKDICFPESDISLEKQLLGYVIDRVTPTGVNVYKGSESAGDHLLDSLMLAIVAFTLEVGPFGKPKYSSDIVFAGSFGESTEPEIFKGDLVVQPDIKHKSIEHRDRYKPTSNRWEYGQTSILSTDMPGNHLTTENSVQLWNWDGFGHDAPRPKVRSLGEAVDEAKRRIGMRRVSGKPTRKNI